MLWHNLYAVADNYDSREQTISKDAMEKMESKEVLPKKDAISSLFFF